MRKILRHAPWLALGPLTGPLAAGVVAYSRARRPFMAGICALGIVEVWIGLPAILCWLNARLILPA